MGMHFLPGSLKHELLQVRTPLALFCFRSENEMSRRDPDHLQRNSQIVSQDCYILLQTVTAVKHAGKSKISITGSWKDPTRAALWIT